MLILVRLIQIELEEKIIIYSKKLDFTNLGLTKKLFRTERLPGSEALQQNIKENDQKALTYIGLKRQLPLFTKQLHLKFSERA